MEFAKRISSPNKVKYKTEHRALSGQWENSLFGFMNVITEWRDGTAVLEITVF